VQFVFIHLAGVNNEAGAYLGGDVVFHRGVFVSVSRPLVSDHGVEVALDFGHAVDVVEVHLSGRQRADVAIEEGLALVDALDVPLEGECKMGVRIIWSYTFCSTQRVAAWAVPEKVASLPNSSPP